MPSKSTGIGSMSASKETSFITADFLLQNETARTLFHNYAKELPIIDYHNHLPPDQIAADYRFSDITELWLKGDHYKWRAMRSLGVNEKYITGAATSKEKFSAWAACVPQLIRNPLFHWSQMELKNSFGLNEFLNADTASAIFDHCNEKLKNKELTARGILNSYQVKMVGTTDDPCDDLKYHWQIRNEGLEFKVAPSFRPDKIFNIEDKSTFIEYLRRLEQVSGINIKSMEDLLTAYSGRIDFFHDCGCRISDHGLPHMPISLEWSASLDAEFRQFISNDHSDYFSDPDCFRGFVLISLCRLYHKKGWVQQFHLGPLRNNSDRLTNLLGPDAGVDSIGDYPQALPLSRFLNALDVAGKLTKTILYNINPADNETFASMAANFNDGEIRGKIQYGSGWWFLDQKDGIEKQINALSNMGTLSTFVGMLTDSRSFLSYSRHEYFRRVLCNMLGDDMEKGLIPNDEKWIGGIVQQVCYFNAKEYFGF